MKRHILIVVAVAMSAFTGTCFAQSNLHLRAQVPFRFVAGGKTFAPGAYEITEVSPGTIELKNTEDHSVMVTRTSEVRADKEMRYRNLLVFNRYENSYFLEQITRRQSDIARQLNVGRAEKEWMASKAQSELVIVSLAGSQPALPK